MFDGAGRNHKYVSNGTGWTEARGEEAKRLWIAGRSASEIMRALSTPEHRLTRSAVISYIHRALPQGTKRATVAPPAMGKRFAWTLERRRRAAELKAEGRTPTEIAAAINAGLADDERASVHSVRAMLKRDAERDGPPAASMPWSPAAVRRIGELWQAGHSAPEVVALTAGELDDGRELTVQAVRGIAERAGYRRPIDTSYRTRAITARAKATAARPPATVSPREYLAPPEPVPSLNVTLFQRGARCCGFVTGETPQGEALYCGLPVDSATRQKLYCAGHHIQTHRPSPPRKISAPASGLRRSGGGRRDNGFLSRWG
ncbi:GcrA family cell cycle regulator [Asticcacaulis sp.]|uniref:GcrA family cell cycle regulator n=1 Tax=Asticcacaulis sp. TaxID=1872648 RepID=UPI003F7C24CA